MDLCGSNADMWQRAGFSSLVEQLLWPPFACPLFTAATAFRAEHVLVAALEANVFHLQLVVTFMVVALDPSEPDGDATNLAREFSAISEPFAFPCTCFIVKSQL